MKFRQQNVTFFHAHVPKLFGRCRLSRLRNFAAVRRVAAVRDDADVEGHGITEENSKYTSVKSSDCFCSG